MIDVVIVFNSLEYGFATTVLYECETLDDVKEKAKWFFENRQVKNLYITIRGEKNEEN